VIEIQRGKDISQEPEMQELKAIFQGMANQEREMIVEYLQDTEQDPRQTPREIMTQRRAIAERKQMRLTAKIERYCRLNGLGLMEIVVDLQSRLATLANVVAIVSEGLVSEAGSDTRLPLPSREKLADLLEGVEAGLQDLVKADRWLRRNRIRT
jgi:hypothetical protein